MNNILWFKGKDGIKDAFQIRNQVFVKEQNVPEEMELDDIDNYADHIIIYNEDKPIATGRMFESDGQVFFGRIAVLKEYRSKHFGQVVVKNLIDKAFSEGHEKIYIHAQSRVQKFYEKLGFKAFGDKYFEAGIEHVSMVITRDK
ncbi:MAG: GNAT family N-acetyltransferase [Clostridium sp.]|nr:GNAT family N-acetyltransferase [Clostridium sp.]